MRKRKMGGITSGSMDNGGISATMKGGSPGPRESNYGVVAGI